MDFCDCIGSTGDINQNNVEVQRESITKTVIFEPTMVGKISKKSVELFTTDKATNYVIKRDPNLNPIYQVFQVKLSNKVVKGRQCVTCVVTYSPRIVDQRNIDFFQIMEEESETAKLCVRGESFGPRIGFSTNILFFYSTKNSRKLMNSFEIKNLCNEHTHYNFDVNEDEKDQELFKIDRIRGILPPYSYAFVRVSFTGTQKGFYSNQLFCRLENHPPLMIRLFAVMSSTIDFEPDLINVLTVTYKYPSTGFEGYMYDSVKRTKIKPPFSLSINYLDFGSVEYAEDSTKSRNLVTCLTNHLDEHITILWMNDIDDIFSICPKKVSIPPQESILYECSFKPSHCDRLYTKLIIGQVFWASFCETFRKSEQLEEIFIPLNLSIILSGRSFPADKLWLPLVKIKPTVVILPPTVPRSPSYTTTMLTSSSDLPTSFKFIPPKKTNFLLKPMQGILHDFQIIVVQLQPDGTNQKPYVERWGIELNGRSDDCVSICLKGFAEDVIIAVGNDNSVDFGAVQPGSQGVLDVVVCNRTVHYLKYNFITDCYKSLSIDYPQGELASNESRHLSWFLTGSSATPPNFSIICQVNNLSRIKMLTGDSSEFSVDVFYRCIYSELCATPSFYDFGQVEYGSCLNMSFHFFNFGESPIHFQLYKKETESDTCMVEMVPNSGTVQPKDKILIKMNINANVVGQQNIQIVYELRLNNMFNKLVCPRKQREVFLITLNCLYATVQFCDIADTNFGFLFSKLTLFNMLNLTEFNHILATIKHDETKTIGICVPEYQMGEAEYFTKLVLLNTTNFPTTVKFEFNKSCPCKKVEKAVGLSFRKFVYECVHMNVLKMCTDKDVIPANGTDFARLYVTYLEHGLTTVCYTMYLTHNRIVHIYVNVTVLPEIVTMPSKYSVSFDFRLQSIFIGELEPPVQVFPLYNNSACVVSYEIDTSKLCDINFHYDFEIFQCLNPHGILQPFKSCNILLKFQPITIETYQVSVPIKMGDEVHCLNIIGEGSDKLVDYYENMLNALPSRIKPFFLDDTVNLSTDVLILKPFQVWTNRKEMIFIRNQSSKKLIGYSWENVAEEGVILVEALRKKGLLQPKESHAIPIRICAFGQPCILNINMTCKLLDHTQHIKHKESAAEHLFECEELEGQFTITDKGTSYPKSKVKVLPKPETYFINLSISACIISDVDRDIHLTVEEQLQQSCQNRLRLDIGVVFTDYCSALIESIEKDSYFRKITDTKKVTFDNTCNRFETFKLVIECIIADIMFSNIFREYLRFSNRLYQPFYLQCTVHGEVYEPLLRKEMLKKKQMFELRRHMQSVKSFLNAPQSTVISEMFKDVIRDGMHNVFKLGAASKQDKGPFEYPYGTVKYKFRCPACKCLH